MYSLNGIILPPLYYFYSILLNLSDLITIIQLYLLLCNIVAIYLKNVYVLYLFFFFQFHIFTEFNLLHTFNLLYSSIYKFFTSLHSFTVQYFFSIYHICSNFIIIRLIKSYYPSSIIFQLFNFIKFIQLHINYSIIVLYSMILVIIYLYHIIQSYVTETLLKYVSLPS